MRGAVIHGILLAVMLVYGYRTWTRDKTAEPTIGTVVLWDKTEADLVSIEYKTDKKIVRIERRGDGSGAYWWGSDTTIEKKPKPPEPGKGSDAGSAAGSNAGSGSGSGSASGSGSGSANGSGSGSAVAAGSGSGTGSGSGSAVAAKAAPEMEETRKVHEFPLGDAADKIIKGLTAARALRDLGPPTDETKKDYKLVDAKSTLTIEFKDGKHSFLIGGPVYGGSDKYVLDQETNKAYVLSKDLLSGLEVGETTLHLSDPRGFDVAKIESVTIEATIDGTAKSKTVSRITTGVEGQQVKTWGDPETKKADQTVANFVDNANNLKPTEYSSTTKTADLNPVLRLTYRDAKNELLGTLTLYKHDKPGELAPEQTLDMANPPKGETEYFIVTEKTRVPALVRKDTAQRSETDLTAVFSDHPVIEPKGNPFGPGAPMPPGHSPVPKMPPPSPHGGSAAPHL